MQAHASQDTLSALVLLARYGQAHEMSSGDWKLKGTDERIEAKQMNGLLILGHVRHAASAIRLKRDGREVILSAVKSGRLPASVRKHVATKYDRRSVRHAA